MLVKVLLKKSVDVGAARKAQILPCRTGKKMGMLKVRFKMVEVRVPGRSCGGAFQNLPQSLMRSASALGRRR